MGKEKIAIFAVIPDDTPAYNFLVGILYTQLFQQLYRSADLYPGKKLPVPVHFLMDEFANVALPKGFDNLLSTMRQRQIFCSIIFAESLAAESPIRKAVGVHCGQLRFVSLSGRQ